LAVGSLLVDEYPMFIVLEGLDGSGKTTAAKVLAEELESRLGKKTLFTYEPNNPSCGGDFIRDVLTKKITRFTPRVLAYAFAANRLDHNDRTIKPHLEKGNDHIVISDRYYLSSLVYQSADDFPFDRVMELNELALPPDIIFFLNVSNETCYQRMNKRNLPPELFETNFEATRQKYFSAIDFLKNTRQERIVEIDGNGTVEETVAQMLAWVEKRG
jgi:dTMP kinase